MSGGSTLDPENFPIMPDRILGRGHGTSALGPSDSSDSGSDVVAGPGLGAPADDGRSHATAGPDIGDADLDSDTDSGGTGERAASGRDALAPDGVDIDVDHIETILPPLELGQDVMGVDGDVARIDIERIASIEPSIESIEPGIEPGIERDAEADAAVDEQFDQLAEGPLRQDSRPRRGRGERSR